MKKLNIAILAVMVAIGLVFAGAVNAAPQPKVVVEDMGDYFLFSSPVITAQEVQAGEPTVIIYCHGGFLKTNKSYPDAKFLARQGYLVAAVKYAAAKSLEEDLAAVKKVRDEVGDGKTFIMGISRGGFLALQAFLSDNDGYDGAIIVAGPTSVSRWHTGFPLSREQKVYFASGLDAIDNVDIIKKPLFLIYGTGDSIVPASQGKLLFAENEDLFDLLLVPAEHGQVSGSTIRFVSPWIEQVTTAAQADDEDELE